VKTLDDVLEGYTKNWRSYSYYYDKILSDKRRTKETRRKFLIEGTNDRRYWWRFRDTSKDEELFFSNNSWAEKIINFICQYNYDFLYFQSPYNRSSVTIKYWFEQAIQRANDIKNKKVQKNKLESALSKLHKEDLIQILLLKNRQLQDITNRFENFERSYVLNEQKTIRAGQRMRAYRGLACVVLDMDVQTVNKLLNNVKKNKVSLQKSLGK